jgi:hypothetical protein
MANKKKNTILDNNEISEDDSDIVQDMKTMGQVRDIFLSELKDNTSLDIHAKISLANALNAVVKSRQDSELLLLRLNGLFDDGPCDDELCETCAAERQEFENEKKDQN